MGEFSMIEKHLVSIIVPIYKVEQYMDECITSIVKQTYSNIEIILVDDGSPDKCPQKCDDWGKRDSRIKVVHKKNAGLGYARNSGLEIASGEYVAFVDSDDYVDTSMFETLYEEAMRNHTDAVFCAYQRCVNNRKDKTFFSKKKLLHGKEILNYIADMIASPAHIKEERLECMSAWNGIYKKKIIDSKNIRFMSEREVVSEDIVFNVDFLKHCNSIALIPQPLYNYCIHENSLSRTFKESKFSGIIRLYTYLIDSTAEYNSVEMKQRCLRLLVEYTLGQINNLLHSSLSLKKKKIIFNTVAKNPIWDKNIYSFKKVLPKIQFLKFCLFKSRFFFLYQMVIATKKILK